MSKEVSEGIELEIKGSFSFSINQYGLNYFDKGDLEDAIIDFWNEFEKSRDAMGSGHNVMDIHLDWDEKDLEIIPS